MVGSYSDMIDDYDNIISFVLSKVARAKNNTFCVFNLIDFLNVHLYY